MPHRRRAPIENGSLCFEVGKHLVRLQLDADGWVVSVDGLSHGARFPSQAEAWLEGVQTAHALETPLPGALKGVKPARERSLAGMPRPDAPDGTDG